MVELTLQNLLEYLRTSLITELTEFCNNCIYRNKDR